MDHTQAEMRFEGMKIAVAMEQLMIKIDAKRGNEAVNRSAYGDTLAAKNSIVLSSGDCKLGAARVEDGKLEQVPSELAESIVSTCTLQDLTENETRQANFLIIANGGFQPTGM